MHASKIVFSQAAVIPSHKRRRWLRRIGRSLLMLFLLLNTVAAFHAWKFTHFAPPGSPRPPAPEAISFSQKIKVLFTGVSPVKPVSHVMPSCAYENVTLPDGTTGWWMPVAEAKGTVVLSHGYGGEKSSMLGSAMAFREWGYNAFAIDLSGAGASGSLTTTIGYKEATQIAEAAAYARGRQGGRLFLFGCSMGAAATMRAVANLGVKADGLVLECPFGTMYETVCGRFRLINIPEIPMAALLTFWGGALNGFNAFSHNPADYAQKISCPVLLIHGAKDHLVSKAEIQHIYQNLRGPKALLECPETGHVGFLSTCTEAWKTAMRNFIAQY